MILITKKCGFIIMQLYKCLSESASVYKFPLNHYFVQLNRFRVLICDTGADSRYRPREGDFRHVKLRVSP